MPAGDQFCPKCGQWKNWCLCANLAAIEAGKKPVVGIYELGLKSEAHDNTADWFSGEYYWRLGT